MNSEQLQKLVESNAQAIKALANLQLESQRATDHQIAEVTLTVSDFVSTTSASVSVLIENRATMYELMSKVSVSQASIDESTSQIAAAITLLASRES